MTVSSPLSAHTLNACMRHVSKTETHCGATGIDADAGSTVRQLASLLNSPRLAKSEISKSQMLEVRAERNSLLRVSSHSNAMRLEHVPLPVFSERLLRNADSWVCGAGVLSLDSSISDSLDAHIDLRYDSK